MGKTLAWFVLVVLLVVGYATFSHFWAIFFVPPIEALPSGGTLVVWRDADADLVDSADAVCRRQSRGLNDFCRGEAFTRATANGIMLRLPYVRWLDHATTGS